MKHLLITLAFLSLSCFGGGNLSPSGDITAVHAGDGLSGGGTFGAVTLGMKSCSAGQVLVYDGDSWECAAAGNAKTTTVNGGSGTLHNIDCGAGTTICRLSFGTLNATGFVAGSAGQVMDVLYIGTSSLTIQHQNAGSLSANQVYMPGGAAWTVGPGGGFRMIYDGPTSKWRVTGYTTNLPSLAVAGNATVGGTLGVTGAISEGADRVISLAGSGLTKSGRTLSIDDAYTQRRVSGTCAAGFSIRAIAADGTVTCEADDGLIGTITTNTLPKGMGFNALGNSVITDTGTLVTVGSGATLNVTGGATLDSTLSVSGYTWLHDQLDVDGPALFTGTLTADSDSLFVGKIDMQGTLGFSGAAPTVVSGDCTVSGKAQSMKVTSTNKIMPASTCVIAFNRTFDSDPYCVTSAAGPITPDAISQVYVTTTTTQVTLHAYIELGSGAVIHVICPDRF